MKKYVKNITDDNKTIVPELGRPYTPATLAFKENGKLITLKPGESAETKLDGSTLAGGGTKRLRIVIDDQIKKKKEVAK